MKKMIMRKYRPCQKTIWQSQSKVVMMWPEVAILLKELQSLKITKQSEVTRTQPTPVQLSNIDIPEEDIKTPCGALPFLLPRRPPGIRWAFPRPPLIRWPSPIWGGSLRGALDTRSSLEVQKERTLNKGKRYPEMTKILV